MINNRTHLVDAHDGRNSHNLSHYFFFPLIPSLESVIPADTVNESDTNRRKATETGKYGVSVGRGAPVLGFCNDCLAPSDIIRHNNVHMMDENLGPGHHILTYHVD